MTIFLVLKFGSDVLSRLNHDDGFSLQNGDILNYFYVVTYTTRARIFFRDQPDEKLEDSFTDVLFKKLS